MILIILASLYEILFSRLTESNGPIIMVLSVAELFILDPIIVGIIIWRSRK